MPEWFSFDSFIPQRTAARWRDLGRVGSRELSTAPGRRDRPRSVVISEPQRPPMQPNPTLDPDLQRLYAIQVETSRSIEEISQSLQAFESLSCALKDRQRSFYEILLGLQPLSLFAQICQQVAEHIPLDYTPAEAIQQNPYILLRLKDNNGLNLIEQLRDQLKTKLEQRRAILELIELQTFAINSISDPSIFSRARELNERSMAMFRALSPLAKGHFCYQIWNLCGRPSVDNFGEEHVLETCDVSMFHEYQGVKIAEGIIQHLHDAARTSLRLNTSFIHQQEVKDTDSEELKHAVYQLYQLENFVHFLEDPAKAADAAFLSQKFEQLDAPLRQILKGLIWIGMHQIGHGKATDPACSPLDFQSLLLAQDQAARPLIKEIFLNLNKKIIAQRKLEEFAPLLQALGQRKPALENQLILDEFKNLTPDTQTHLEYFLWLESGGRINPHFGGPDWGKKAIENNPRCLLSVLDAETRRLYEKAGYRIQNALTRPWLNQQIIKSAELPTFPSSIHQPVNMLRFTATTVKTALAAPPRMFAESLPIASADCPYMDHEISSISQNGDAQNLSLKVAGLLPFFIGQTGSQPVLAQRNINTVEWGVFEDSGLPEWNFRIAERCLHRGESCKHIEKYSDVLHTVIKKERLQLALPQACAIPIQSWDDEEAERKIDIFAPLLDAMRQEPSVSNEDLLVLFNRFDRCTKNRLLERLWYESGGKTNPHFGGHKWGEIAVQNNPRLLIPFLEAEIQHIRNPTFFLIIDQKSSGTDFKTAFYQLTKKQQRRCAEDLCRFIVLTGYHKISFDRMSIVDGKIKLHDLPLHSAATIGEARANARNTLNWLTLQCPDDDFPIMRIAAEQQLDMLNESEIDSPHAIQAYRAFAKAMKDPLASNEQKQAAFQRMPTELCHFIHFCVWSGFKDMGISEGHLIGRKRLEADINILTELQNASGMNILEQFEVRYSLSEVLNILRLTRRMLSQENVRPEALYLFVDTLEKTMLGLAILTPIAQNLMQKIEAIQSTGSHLSDEALFEQIKTALIGSPAQEGILDIYIHTIDATKRQLSTKAISERVKLNRESNTERFPVKPTRREQIQVTRSPQTIENLSQRMRVMLVAYECAKYGFKYGGLGEAVYGIATSLKSRGCEVTILMPKFSGLPGPLNERIAKEGKATSVNHMVSGRLQEDRVLTIDQEPDLHLAYLENTDAARNCFDIPSASQIYQDGALAVPGKEWHGLKERLIFFGSATAEFVVAQKGAFDAVLYNDWHSSYAISSIRRRYFDRWACGDFPANVFIIHNNNYGCQGVYGTEESDILQMFGDNRRGFNLMTEVIEMADCTLTVSETFAEEMQEGPLTSGIGPSIRRSAHNGKFKGITNGSNPELWDPRTNDVLKNWKDPITGVAIDLSYSPETEDLVAHKKQLIGEQLFRVLEKWFADALDALNIHSAEEFIRTPFIGYIGRYDSTQKGIDKFDDVLEAVHAKGAKFVSLGIGEDAEATQILDALEEKARRLGAGWITRGKGENASLKMQLGQKADLSLGIMEDIPPLGPLWRAFIDITIVPSKFEPCGLVHLEEFGFGALTIGTRTGGLADTIVSDQSHPRFNGFTYERLYDWASAEQSRLVFKTTSQALDYWMSLSKAGKQKVISRLMKDVFQLSWTASPEGLSPSERYVRLIEDAIAAKKTRHTQKTDLLGIEDDPAPARDNYFGVGKQTQLYNIFGAHIQDGGGVNFRVMAPAAQNVKVITIELDERKEPTGKETEHEMHKIADGSWQTLVATACEGTRYQYEIVNAQGELVRKLDPFAFGFDPKDRRVCRVTALPKDYAWTDSAWMADRPNLKDRPKNIYEVHIPSWFKPNGQFVHYQEIARRLVAHCKEVGFTQVELFGVYEHFLEESMGYQSSGYFAPTARNGSLKDFQEFVDILHKNELAVIIDFVPAHFAKDDVCLRSFDGTSFFEEQDDRNRLTPWGTPKVNFKREDVRNFLLSSVHFFLEECHIDGMRVDAVAHFIAYSRWREKDEWNPAEDGTVWDQNSIQFCRDMNKLAHEMHAFTISENSWPYTYFDTLPVDDPSGKGLGFDLRFGMEARRGLRDYLAFNLERRSKQDQKNSLRECLIQGSGQKFIGPFTSHDEIRHEGYIATQIKNCEDSQEDLEQKIKLWYATSAFMPHHARMTSMGTEYGLDGHFDPTKGLNWQLILGPEYTSFKDAYARINHFYLKRPVFWDAGENLNRFNWVSLETSCAVIAYERIDPSNLNKRYLVVHNFANRSFENFSIRDREQEAIREIKQARIIFRSDKAGETRLGPVILLDSHRSRHTKKLVLPELPKYGTLVIEQTV